MPITGFYCRQGQVPFEECLTECATGGMWPPCGFPYSVLAGE